MKIKLNFLIIFVLNFSLFFVSCKTNNEPVDPRDEYVGDWNYIKTGNIDTYLNGSIIGTNTINETGIYNISKLGADSLLIGNSTDDLMRARLSGTTLTLKSQSITTIEEGGTSTVKYVWGGIVNSKNSINISSTLTGTFNMLVFSGTISGNIAMVLTKK